MGEVFPRGANTVDLLSVYWQSAPLRSERAYVLETMEPDWIDLGELSSLPDGQPALRKGSGRRFVCVRRGDAVHALDDRCPHQGYPLSEGSAQGDVLTCAWHNWKFDVASGSCLFGGDAVRRYPTRVVEGRVHLDIALDVEGEAARVEAGLRQALFDDDPGRAVREGLRLGALRPGASLGAVERAFEVIAADGAIRAEYGFDHPLAVLADLAGWVERGWISGADALAVVATAAGEASRKLPPRGAPGHLPEAPDDTARVALDLAADRREDAEARVRHLCRSLGVEQAGRRGLLPFAASHVLDYGHGAIFLAKALELAARFPGASVELLASSAVELGWATAETALPPFAATRDALDRLAELRLDGPPSGFDRSALEVEILASERQAVAAVLGVLGAGAEPRAVLLAVARASALRLARFDASWEERLTAEVTVLDVSHALTFCEAALTLSRGEDPALAARFAVLAAGFVGKLRRADGPPPTSPSQASTPASSSPSADLASALVARDLDGALALTRGLDASGRAAAYSIVAPFAALEAAVRPIFLAHHIKTTEACARLDALDPGADGAYLAACLSLVVPRRRERFLRRVSATAVKFLGDGRPPEGLY